MTTDNRLEAYLTQLERALKSFPASDRAEIITEIKSHALSALERDPNSSLDTVLAALGEPQTVANRYLMERGLKPSKPPISPVVKWLVIGFLGTFAMVLIFAAFVISRFTPILKVDEQKDRVTMFGGLLDISGKEGRIRLNGTLKDLGGGNSFSGSAPVGAKESVEIRFSNGKIDLRTSDDNQLAWDCRSKSDKVELVGARPAHGGLLLDMNVLAGVKCEISVPAKTRLSIKGGNGKIDISEPHYDVTADLASGMVEFEPDESHAYRYNIAVDNGHAATFESSDSKDAHAINIHLKNGKVSREN